MEYNQFKQLIELKGIREKESVRLLDDFIQKFPYCQTSRLLYAKALHDQNNIHYDQHLKLAAAYAPNREVLRDLIEMKTTEVEFEFPLPKKEIPVEEPSSLNAPVAISPAKEEPKYEEWYSEDEISGRAFEEQKEKEIPVDPHEVIRKRLSEILGESPAQENKGDIPQKEMEDTVEVPEDVVQQTAFVTEEIISPPVDLIKPGPEVTVFKEELAAEEKIEEEQLHPVAEKSNEEKTIIAQSEKAIDVLDKMELEHALEESILDSLEKLPPLSSSRKESRPSIKEVEQAEPKSKPEKVIVKKSLSPESVDLSASRSFTSWLKVIGSSPVSGFEEVHAKVNKVDVPVDEMTFDENEERDLLLSDDELIEKFLLEDPKIEASRAEFYSPVSQAKKSVMDHDDVVSETLAQIYLQQGNNKKARWSYEKLILLHPEKSAFFAALLKEIPEGE